MASEKKVSTCVKLQTTLPVLKSLQVAYWVLNKYNVFLFSSIPFLPQFCIKLMFTPRLELTPLLRKSCRVKDYSILNRSPLLCIVYAAHCCQSFILCELFTVHSVSG